MIGQNKSSRTRGFYWIHICPQTGSVLDYDKAACLALESAWNRRKSKVTIFISHNEWDNDQDLIAHVFIDYEDHRHYQRTLRGGQREVYRLSHGTSIRLPCDKVHVYDAHKAYTLPHVGWVHLDPVNDNVEHYEQDVAETLEDAYATGTTPVSVTITLPNTQLLDVAVHLESDGRHYQRTPTGYRDVRRLIQDTSDDRDTITLPVHKLGDTHGLDAYRWRFYTEYRADIAIENQHKVLETDSLRIHDLKLPSVLCGPPLMDFTDTSKIMGLYGIDMTDLTFTTALKLVTSEIVRLSAKQISELYNSNPMTCTIPLCIDKIGDVLKDHLPTTFVDVAKNIKLEETDHLHPRGWRNVTYEWALIVFALAALVHVVDPITTRETLEKDHAAAIGELGALNG